MIIKIADFQNPSVIALLNEHLSGMNSNSPAGSVYAFDYSRLQYDDISLWTAWENDHLLGFGALKELTPTSGEIKSMRTKQQHYRKGVAATILEHIIGVAKKRKYSRLSLETGSGDAFEAALTLYLKYGFVAGAAFGEYEKSEFNQFFHLPIS